MFDRRASWRDVRECPKAEPVGELETLEDKVKLIERARPLGARGGESGEGGAAPDPGGGRAVRRRRGTARRLLVFRWVRRRPRRATRDAIRR